MRIRGRCWTAVLLAAAALVAPSVASGQARDQGAVATTPHFAFYSDFNTNLNDALMTAGRMRRAREPELFQSGPEKTCFARLPMAARAAWTRAVDYYAENVSPVQYADRPQVVLRLELAGVLTRNSLADPERRFVETGTEFRTAAAPAYARCHWPVQNAVNRRWIERVVALLTVHEEAIGSQLPQLYGTLWAGLPFRVDVVENVDRTGANSVNLMPPGLHVLVSSSSPSNQDRAALEVVFHEASHFLTGRGTPLPTVLAAAARDLGNPIGSDLTHQVQFYMTGEVVRRVLERAGGPPYTPYLYAQRLFGDRFRDAIKTVWPAYMDRKRTLTDAAADLMRALGDR